MPFEIASLSSSDTTIKVLRNKPFNIALSSFLSISSDEAFGSPKFSSGLFYSVRSNSWDQFNREGYVVVSPSLSSNSTPNTTRELYLWSSLFASITCDNLPSGVNFFKERNSIYYYCDPFDLLINSYPSNTRLYGTINTSGTYEFYLKANILFVPNQYYKVTADYLSYGTFSLPHDSYSQFVASLVPEPSGNVAQPLQIGEERDRDIIRVSSDTIKVTLVVEDPPDEVNSNPNPNPNLNPTQATTGSSTSEVELHVVPITTSTLTSSARSITVPFTATRIATTSAPTQSFMVKFGGVNVMDAAFVTTSIAATSCVISAKISKTSSSMFRFDISINSSIDGVQQQSITRTKSVSISSFSNSNLSLHATNAAGSSAPIISNYGNIINV
jgi:hypothetical protein